MPAESRAGLSTTRVPLPDRIVWQVDRGIPGPTSVFVACLHGNEGMTLRAVHRIHEQLLQCRGPFRGCAYAVIGNRTATSLGERYIDRDLNRVFRYTPSCNPRIDLALPQGESEYEEARDLLHLLTRIASKKRSGQMYVVDMHTFSGAGKPFVVLSDTLRNRAFASCWPLPIILGLSERLEGTLADFLTACGCVAAVVESGQHDDERAAHFHEAALRLALVRAGHIENGDIGDVTTDAKELADAVRGLPKVLDVRVRRGIRPDEGFMMRPGFANFQKVRRNEHLADTELGPVRAQRSGRILLPLYQKQGDDGYFIARPIGRFWLRLSALLRRTQLSRLAHWLPGVSPSEFGNETFVVDRSIARWLAEDVFHLFGYRLVRRRTDRLLVSRHCWDMNEPETLRIDLPSNAEDH